MSVVERVGEALARRTDRRRYLGRSAAVAFGAVAAWAVEGVRPPGALAAHCAAYDDPGHCHCHLPGGRRCPGKGCAGSQCSGKCRVDTTWYATGCWCTLTCPNPNGGGEGYYKCCDCDCNGRKCGCQEFVAVDPGH